MRATHVTVQKVGDGLGVRLSQELLDSLSLHENDVFDVETTDGKLEMKPAVKMSRVLEAYRRTRTDHEAVYCELAK